MITRHSIVTMASVIISMLAAYVQAEDFHVSSVSQLHAAVQKANRNQQADRIFVAKGVYPIQRRIVLKEADTAIIGITLRPSDVILRGRGMRKRKKPEVLIDVYGDNITLSGLTLEAVANHLIQVRAETDADNFTLSNCVLRDSYEQMVKVSGGPKAGVAYANNGRVENCVFEYTAGIGPQYYIGGIDAHRAHNWVIQGNTFKAIASPQKRVAEHAIHLWNDSKDNLVADNTFVNCDRGVGFGMYNKANQHSGGVIRDNVFFHTASKHLFADASIVLESSPRTKVLNNRIYQHHRYPNGIEYRFERTQDVLIQGNWVNRRIQSRNGGQATVIDNKRY